MNENFPGWKTLNLTELLNFTPCCDFSDTLKNSSGEPPNSTLLTPFLNSVKSVNPTRSLRGQTMSRLYWEVHSVGHCRSWADFAFYLEVGPGNLRKTLIPFIQKSGSACMFVSNMPYTSYKVMTLYSSPQFLSESWSLKITNRALFAKMESLKHLPQLKIEPDFF